MGTAQHRASGIAAESYPRRKGASVADSTEHSLGTRIMAKRCESCPLCKRARENPDTRFGKIMAWHGTWCPFWQARERVYGDETRTGGGMKAG